MSNRNLALPGVWQRSLRRSRERRAAALREARRRLRTRGGVVCMCSLLAAGAVGADFASGHSVSSAVAGSAPAMLQAGSTGPSVADVQSRIGVAADGVFGPETEKAVRSFQERKGLAVDGVAGPQTLSALGLGGGSGQGQTTPARGAGGGVPGELQRIAQCESGGNPQAVNGPYRGKYQFTRETWAGVGGTGDPADAPEAEQDRRAVALYEQSGTSPWASCA